VGTPHPPAQRIVVLTPLKNATAHLERYFELLYAIDYPRELVSLGFLESDSTDGTFEAVSGRLAQLNRDFRRARVWKRDYHFRFPPGVPRWAAALQPRRREVLARSRNYLLSVGLDDAEWAFWVDVDLIEYPAGILRTLLETGKDILHPHCVKHFGGKTFDCNAWKDQGRIHMDGMRGGEELVALDSVGGTMLLVRADLHREGLIFPPCYYGRPHPRSRRTGGRAARWMVELLAPRIRGEIETEGLALLADDMGVTCWGMPNLEVRHKDE
jgi:hypothetical protein